MSDFVVVFCVIGFFLALGAVAWLVNANYGVGRESWLHNGAICTARLQRLEKRSLDMKPCTQ
jgi:hypothetical protein